MTWWHDSFRNVNRCFYFQPPFCRGLLHTCRNFGANRVARVATGHAQRRFQQPVVWEMVDGGWCFAKVSWFFVWKLMQRSLNYPLWGNQTSSKCMDEIWGNSFITMHEVWVDVIYHDPILGEMIQFDLRMIFRWVGKKPPTTLRILTPQNWLFWGPNPCELQVQTCSNPSIGGSNDP